MSSLTLFEDFKSLFSDNLDFLYVHLNGYQLILDLVLLLLFLYVLFRKPAKPEKPLSEEEVEELIEGWVPEPLIPAKTPLMELDEKIPVISSTTPTHVTINGRNTLNMARFNFLGMIGNPKVEESASKALYKYGTGTCGPRGFYGTIDIHLELESRIKKFMKTEDCVIYSFGFATIASVIPSFSGRGDILIVDKGVSFSVQTGAKLSRSDILWFEHNDMADLERVLKKVKEQDLKTRREITRRYIVVEGVYINYGDICPLPKIMELKEKYCFRLMLEDSYAIGSLGKMGRGTTEFFNIPAKDVEFLTGNLAAVTSSVGGFCCGSKPITVHQRLNSSGYVYSASLPPLLAAASITAFDIIDENPNLLSQLANNIETIHKALQDIEGFVISGSPNAALFHLKVAKSTGDRYSDEVILQDLVDEALAGGVLLTRAKYVHAKESFLPPPSIRITVSSANTKEQLLQVANVVKAAASKVMQKRGDLDKEQSKENIGVARRTAVK